MNGERKACRAKYFIQAKVEHLKESKPSAWWNEIKKLSGCSPAATERSYVTKSLQHLYGRSDDITLAHIINKAFLSPMRSFTPLPADYVILPTNSGTQQPALVVSNESVYKKLMKLNRSKAHGPDGIPGWVLKENADLLAAPIADILNSSYREDREECAGVMLRASELFCLRICACFVVFIVRELISYLTSFGDIFILFYDYKTF